MSLVLMVASIVMVKRDGFESCECNARTTRFKKIVTPYAGFIARDSVFGDDIEVL